MCLEIVLHEMCHALLYLACQCDVCGCHLNRINGEGMRYHGPAWQSVRRSVEDTANLHLTGLYRPFNLCHDLEPDLDLEKKTEFKVLHRLSCKIEQRDNVVYKERVLERAARRAERQPNTPEDSRSHEVLIDK